jgi:hypothetical protein
MMPTNTQLNVPDYVPHTAQLYVDRLRRFLNDTAVANVLEEVVESDDTTLYEAIQDAMDEINLEFLPVTTYTAISQFPWTLLKLGATLQVLIGKGILSARNQLTFNDSGGITVSDYDKYGRYVNWFNVLIAKYQRGVMSWKLTSNVENAYSDIPSEYRDIGSDQEGLI